jgi:hypothetical protein
MDVKHYATILLSHPMLHHTCICHTCVLFRCVSTFTLKRYTFICNPRLWLWIPMWKYETDDFYYKFLFPSPILQTKQPLWSLILTVFKLLDISFPLMVLRFFVVDSQKGIICVSVRTVFLVELSIAGIYVSLNMCKLPLNNSINRRVFIKFVAVFIYIGSCR